jgi:hypothetical protein
VSLLYHGGVAGLNPGDKILPRTQSGMPLDGQGAFILNHDHYVHLTSDENFARLFAAGAPGGGCGDLYEVEHEGTLEPDPDTQFGVCSLAGSAIVVRVVERAVAEPPAPYRDAFWPLVLMELRARRPASNPGERIQLREPANESARPDNDFEPLVG